MYLCGYGKMDKSTPMVILTRVILSFPLCAGEAAQEMSRDLYIGKKNHKTPPKQQQNPKKPALPYLIRSVF